MRATKKEEQLILDIYRRIYSEIGVDLDELIEQGVTKEIGWDSSYFLAQEKQDEIIEEMLSKIKMTKLKRQMLRNTLYLGCLPSSTDFCYKLTRTDGLIKQSSRIKWIKFDENGKFKESFTLPLVGRSLLMSPFSTEFTWLTTEVTDILEENTNIVRFKTKNSEYKLEKIIK